MASATGSERVRRHLAGALIATALLAPARLARADGGAPGRPPGADVPAPVRPPGADVSAAEKAAAEALFEHGKGLMKEGRFAEACAKFQESQRVDPGLGTMLYLADCFEKNGQTASAWGEFLDAAAAARAAGQPDREKKARERATALEGRLNKLSITLLPGADVPGLVVKRDGAVVLKATFGTPVPLDPGEHTVEAAAPGKKPWSTKLRVDPANLAGASLVIPVLEDAPAPPPPAEPPKGAALPGEPPRPLVNEPGRPAPKLEAPPPIVRETTSPVRVVGGVLIGVGLGVAGAGGILGTLALLKSSDSRPECYVNNRCTAAGTDTRNAALTLARDSNITLIAGATAFTTGLVILLATKAPSSSDRQVFQVGPMIGAGTGGLSIAGGF
jgi:hypothetical protein